MNYPRDAGHKYEEKNGTKFRRYWDKLLRIIVCHANDPYAA